MIEKEMEVTRRRLDRDALTWEECYERFKDRLAEVERYENKIRDLEAEIEKRKMIFGIFRKEKAFIIQGLLVLTLSSAVFLRIISRYDDPQLHLIAGLLIGVGLATLLNIWIEVSRLPPEKTAGK